MIKFYLKVMLKSPIFIISMLFMIFIMIVQLSALNFSIHLYSRINFYGYISFNLFLLLSCTYVMNKNYELADFLEKNLFKKFISILLTSIIISSLVFIIPFVVIIIYTWNKISFVNFYEGIFNYFILWSLSNCLSSIIGCTIGLLLRKWYSYIFSFIIYVGYISCLYGPSKSVFDRLICVFSDNIFINQNDLAPILFNKSYYLDKLFIILFILAIINLIYLIINKKKIYPIPIISFFLIITLFIAIIPTSNKLSKIGVENYDNFSTSDYIINDYKMDLKLTSTLKNSSELDVKILNDIKSITFMLDNTFNIDSILINDNTCKFSHKNNKVTINSSFLKNTSIKIKINYSGYVDISNYLGVNTYYVNNRYINLPGEKFYWYPSINNDIIHSFNINLNSRTAIYSNLNIESMGENGNNYEYNLKGDDVALNIFSGDYQVITDENITYILPKTYKIDLFKIYLNDLSKKILEDNSSTESNMKSDILKNKSYKKVIVSDWYSNTIEKNLGNEIQFYNDTLIINLGV
ncbi:hypothetical protein KPL40_18055 [Clostridium gasigenes]|uniref:hypothetical protein n=1 Tax=Clostridium gasigenes TaxID=94869 RepID=UPI001C0C2CF0|nr:hypothetical protein [Clostridium gasigenes]MBU3134326.1 hypothetical protein [Clostridium gasigenes]